MVNFWTESIFCYKMIKQSICRLAWYPNSCPEEYVNKRMLNSILNTNLMNTFGT